MSGAHRNLNEKTSVARLKKPMTSSVNPTSRSQAESVSKISRKGRPDEKPSAIMASARGSRKAASASRVVRVGAAWVPTVVAM